MAHPDAHQGGRRALLIQHLILKAIGKHRIDDGLRQTVRDFRSRAVGRGCGGGNERAAIAGWNAQQHAEVFRIAGQSNGLHAEINLPFAAIVCTTLVITSG